MSIKSEVANVKENLINSRKAILARGGEIATDAGFKDLPSAILNIPPDFALSFIEDDGVAYQKTAPENSLPYAQIKKIGGMTYKSKNLIPFPYADTDKTENGITWTINTDGSVTANGTSTGNSYFTFVKGSTLLTIPYDMTISGCPSGGHSLKFEIHVWKEGFTISDIGSSNKVPAGTTYEEIYAVVRAGYTANNLTFKPMLNAGNTALPYEPYFEGLRNAAVEAIESKGLNLWNPNVTQIIEKDYSANTEKREFSENAWYQSITANNYWIKNIENVVVKNNKVSFYAKSAGYGMGRAFRCKPNTVYSFECDYKGDMSGIANWGFYDADGNWLSWSPGGKTRTTPNGCYWILIVLASSADAENNCEFSNMKLAQTDSEIPDIPYVGTIDTFAIPQAVQSIDGYGCGIKENVHNYVDFTKKQFVDMLGRIYEPKVSSVGKHENGQLYAIVHAISEKKPKANGAIISTNYNSTSWSDEDKMVYSIGGSIIINDSRFSSIEEAQSILNQEKTIIYYELEMPEVTDISSLLAENNFIKVEGGGNLTFENEYGYAVPSTVKYVLGVG